MMDVLIIAGWITLGAFFGMMVMGLAAASGRSRLEEENIVLRSKLHKMEYEKVTTPYPIEGAD